MDNKKAIAVLMAQMMVLGKGFPTYREAMEKAIDALQHLDNAVDDGYLRSWFIHSVGEEDPVWTDEHIDELLEGFIVIPKKLKD